jgi:uncharacterized coiled-coil protein SlyX
MTADYAALEARVAELELQMRHVLPAKIDAVSYGVGISHAEMREQFGVQGERLDRIELQLGEHGERLDRIESQLGEHGERLSSIDSRLDSHGAMLAEILRRLPPANPA